MVALDNIPLIQLVFFLQRDPASNARVLGEPSGPNIWNIKEYFVARFK